jgi:cytochrome c biogenesis protein CcdA
MNELSGMGFFAVFAGGVFSFFSPCIFPLIPVYWGVLSGRDPENLANSPLPDQEKDQAHMLPVQGLLFVAGISTVFISLGFFSGSFGLVLAGYRSILVKLAGALVILFGLMQLGVLVVPALLQERRFKLGRKALGPMQAYLLGVLFSFGWTPCIGPVLSSILLLASTQREPVQAAWLLFIYTLGFSIPFIAGTFFTTVFLRHYRKIAGYLDKIRLVGGIMLVLMGLLLFFDQLNSIPMFLP